MKGLNLGPMTQGSRNVSLSNGENVEVRKLNLTDWATLEDEAIQAAKRSLVETYTRNLDLIPPDMRQAMVEQAFRRAEDLRADNLPTVTVKIKAADGTEQDVPLGYAHYWMGRTIRGKLTAVWLSVRKSKPQWTLDDAANFFAAKEADLETVADAVGDVSRPTLGNAEAPQGGAQAVQPAALA